MRHSKSSFIKSISLLLVFALVCGIFSGLRFNVNAADNTVLFNGVNTDINVNGYDSMSGSNYVFKDTLTIEIVSPADTAFNRYTLVYTSDAHLQGTIYYTLDSRVYSEEFFLEPGTGEEFSSLIDGYLNSKKGTKISKIELKLINTSSAGFSLEQINTTVYEVQKNQTLYIENARFKVGINLIWGGGLSYLEDKNDGDATVSNMLNNHDTGRLVQQSYYGTTSAPYVCAEYNNQTWSYNPVQGGDQYQNKSKLVDFIINEDSVYVKCRPLDWAQNNKYTLSYMENLYTITDEYVAVDNRFIDFSTYNHGPEKDQELPAFYTISYLDTFTFYNGNDPWTGDELTVKKNLPFWGGNEDAYFNMESGNTETWCAWTSSARGYGIGLYTPNITKLLAGRNAYNGSKSASNSATNYVAPLIRTIMRNCEAFEYRYLITTGTVDEIRSVFTENRDVTNRVWDTVKVSLPIDGDTLRKVNDAVGKYGAEGASGPSYQSVGYWNYGTGTSEDYLLPFSTDMWDTGTTDHIVFMNFGNFIRISKDIDLSKYSKAYITYSVAGGTDTSGNCIGFFSKPTAFGQAGSMNTDGLLAGGDIYSDYVGANWNVFKTIEVDINTNYVGELYLSYYMNTTAPVCITGIEFELKDSDDEMPNFDEFRVRMVEDDADTNNWGRAVILGQEGNYYGVHFMTNDAFSGVFIPQLTDVQDGGYVDYTLSVYKWDTDYDTSVNGQPVTSADGKSTNGYNDIYIHFGDAVPAGEYLLVLSVTDSEGVGAGKNGMHLCTGVLPKDQDYLERFVNDMAGVYGDRYAAFRLIADISADASDFFDTLGLPLVVDLSKTGAGDYGSKGGYDFLETSEDAFKLTVPNGYSLKGLVLHEVPTWNADPSASIIKFKVYQWNTDYSNTILGGEIDVVNITSHIDRKDLVVDFDDLLPAGTYLIVMEVIEGTFGLSWGPADAGLEAYDVAYYRNGNQVASTAGGALPYASIKLVKSGEPSKTVDFVTSNSNIPECFFDSHYTNDYSLKLTVPKGYSLQDLVFHASPTYGKSDEENSRLQVTVYQWNTDYLNTISGAVVDVVDILSHQDMADLVIEFNKELPAGTYLICMKATYEGQPHAKDEGSAHIPGQGCIGFWWGSTAEGLAEYDVSVYRGGGMIAPAAGWNYLPYASITLVKETYTLEFEGTDNCDIEITSNHEIEDGKISGISEGSTVKFKLTAKEGYDASKAIVTANGSVINPDGEGVYSVKVKSNTTVTVSGVTKKVYDVTISESSNGEYNSDAEETTVEHGGTYTFTVNVAPGYKVTNITGNVGNVENWTLNGDSIEVTISNVTDNLNITIDAAPINVTFEYSDEKLGTQKESVTAAIDDYEGKTDDILSAPADIPDAYTFDGWYVGDTEITKDNISQYFTGHEDQTVTLTAKYTFNHKEAFKADTSESKMTPNNGKWTWNLAVSWDSIFDEYLENATVIAGGFFYNNNDENEVLSKITAADIEELCNEFANQSDGSRIEYGQYKDDGSNTRAYFVKGNYPWNQDDKTFNKNITNIPDNAVHCAVGWFAVQFEDGHVEYYISEIIYSITATDSGRTM